MTILRRLIANHNKGKLLELFSYLSFAVTCEVVK